MSSGTSRQPFDTGVRPEDLDPERPIPFDAPDGHFALYTVDGRVLAASSFCPHLLGPLFQGTQSESEVTCPWHRWRYSLSDGRCTYRPEGGAEAAPPIEVRKVDIGPAGTYRMR